jgi:hypothetical protein
MINSILDSKDQIHATLGEFIKPNLMFRVKQLYFMNDSLNYFTPCGKISKNFRLKNINQFPE